MNLQKQFPHKQLHNTSDYITESRYTFNEYIKECSSFNDYMDFLIIEAFALPQVSQLKPKTNWGDVKAGFDQVADIGTRKKIAKGVRQTRKKKLLGKEGSNPKLAKEGINLPEFRTKGLSLAPANESGRLNTCSCATRECKAACLNKAGRGAMSSVQTARVEKTNFMADHPHKFMAALHDELDTHEKTAVQAGFKPVVRLNVVSDIPYEKLHPEVFTQHPNVQFYDYTKVHSRLMNPDGSPKPQSHPNYHLTLSSTGIQSPAEQGNWKHVRQHLDNGGIAAMVFALKAGRGKKEGDALPEHVFDEKTGKKYRVFDGDKHDHRHADKIVNEVGPEEGMIMGLRIKGGKRALASAGNFAVKVPAGQNHVSVPDIHN